MLHILDGESSARTLGQTGVPGKIFAWREVLMTGPTPSGVNREEWRRLRAKHLSESYRLNLSQCEKDLDEQEKLLESFHEHDEVVLWFEHDLFCQTNLLYLLNWFAGQDLAKTKISLVSIDRFPGISDFRGLGQLNAEQLGPLYEQRKEVTHEQIRTGVSGWQAYGSPAPSNIERFLETNSAALPFLARALRLHLARFPSIRNGLGRIENLGLQLIAEGAQSFADLFSRFGKLEPVYGLGDLQFWLDMKRLSDASTPLIVVHGAVDDRSTGRDIANLEFEITDTGRRVLSGAADFIKLNGIDQWLGGVHLQNEKSVWRWDDANGRLTQGL